MHYIFQNFLGTTKLYKGDNYDNKKNTQKGKNNRKKNKKKWQLLKIDE